MHAATQKALQFFFYCYALLCIMMSVAFCESHGNAKDNDQRTEKIEQGTKKEEEKVIPPYFRIKDICITVIKKGIPIAYLKMTFDLKASETADSKIIEALIPRYRSHCYMSLIPLLCQRWPSDNQIKVEQILPHLEKYTTEIFGGEKIEKINTKMFYMHVPEESVRPMS